MELERRKKKKKRIDSHFRASRKDQIKHKKKCINRINMCR